MHKKYSKSHIKGAKTCKNGKMHEFSSLYSAQTQQNFALSHDRVTVTFRNSGCFRDILLPLSTTPPSVELCLSGKV